MAERRAKNGRKHPENATTVAGGALDDASLFVLVARLESFAEASRRASIPTSTVSRAIARLEERLGVRLLQRTSRRVAVTDEGRELLARAAPLVDGLGEALAATADRRAEPSGLVRVTAPAYTGGTRVAAALADFACAHPQVTIELDPSNTPRDLVDERFDFGIRVGPVIDADFVARRLWSGRFGLFAAPALARELVGKRGKIARDALARAPAVVTRTGGDRDWRFRDARGRVVEVRPTARFAVNDPRAAVEVARRGAWSSRRSTPRREPGSSLSRRISASPSRWTCTWFTRRGASCRCVCGWRSIGSRSRATRGERCLAHTRRPWSVRTAVVGDAIARSSRAPRLRSRARCG